jgi:hypothetical protein
MTLDIIAGPSLGRHVRGGESQFRKPNVLVGRQSAEGVGAYRLAANFAG